MAQYICAGCGFPQDIPTHHDIPMDEKEGKLVCSSCGHTADIPQHCGDPMKRQ